MKGVCAALALALLTGGCSRQSTQAAGKRMIVLGIDGMDPLFLEAHWSSLPNLARLRSQGDFKRLGTTVPPQSPVAWSTVTTGMDPGGHGLFDFVHRNPQTRMPISSMAEVAESSRTITIGPYVLPLSGGSVKSTRAGRAFWQILADHKIPATVIRMPANFPAVECEAESLSGMGTPDLRGTSRTWSFYTNDPAEKRTSVSGGGEIHQAEVKRGRAVLKILGPPNTLRKDQAISSVDLTVDVDPSENVARLELDGNRTMLRQGEWSDWYHASFPLITGLKSAAGIFRVYLQQVHPYLRLYVSPVNLDPADPALPISTPATFSRTLADAVGPYYTEGIAEETGAYRAGLFSRAEFLTQSKKVLADSMRMFRRELDRFHDGLLFYYFSSVDQNAHMLWGRYDDDLLEIYKGVDIAIGEAMAKAGTDTTFMVISDHGFARFDRAVHLNTFLMKQGFLVLDDPTKTGDDELFAHVDWGKTVAYAVGLKGLYLNLEGREDGGIVPAVDKQVILDRIAARLKEFKDPANGENVVDTVYFADKAFQGKNLKYSPDILVGFRRGYRASWQTAL